MNDDAKQLSLQVANDASGSDGAAAPRQKVWVTPKVITSAFSDGTGHSAGVSADHSGATHS